MHSSNFLYLTSQSTPMYGDSLYRPTQETTIFFVWRNSHLFPGVEPSTYTDHTQHFARKFRPIFSRHIHHNHNFFKYMAQLQSFGGVEPSIYSSPKPLQVAPSTCTRCRGEYFPKNYNLPPWQLWKIIFKAASSLRGFQTLHTTYEFFNGAGYFTLYASVDLCLLHLQGWEEDVPNLSSLWTWQRLELLAIAALMIFKPCQGFFRR